MIRFKPGIPHAIHKPDGTAVMCVYLRRITFNRTGHTYMSFRYWAACWIFAQLARHSNDPTSKWSTWPHTSPATI